MGIKIKPAKFDCLSLYDRLARYYGPSGWWPGQTPLEIIVGAVLTQNTAWGNVEKALSNLKAAGVLNINALYNISPENLASLIRPSGYYNIKAIRLKNLISMIMDTSGDNLDDFLNKAPNTLRDTLLLVKGIGKETADSICCYAADKLMFVIDAYTKRILLRHGIIDTTWGYDQIQDLFESELPADIQVYKDLHAYIVFVGKNFCKATSPKCDSCPLQG